MAWADWRDRLAPLGGAYRDDEAENLYNLAGRVPEAEWIVEVGSYWGFSGLCLAAGSLDRPLARLVLVDLWGCAPVGIADLSALGLLLKVAQEHGLIERVMPLRMRSVEAAALWPTAARIGLLHIDATHARQALLDDVAAWQAHLAPGALMLLHDCYYHYDDMDLAVDEIRSRPEWSGWQIVGTQGFLRWGG